jgi:hypothetical protein
VTPRDTPPNRPSDLGEYWITLDFLDSESRAIEDATGAFDERVGFVSTSEPSDGTAAISFQVEAVDASAAHLEAEGLFAELRAAARLPPDPPLAGDVMVLREPVVKPPGEPTPPELPPYRRLLAKAEALHTAGEHAYATVAAQTACELAIALAVRRQLALQSDVMLRAVSRLIGNRWNMSDGPVRAVWTALTGDELGKARFWKEYEAHLGRRHSVVHKGSDVSLEDASASIAVAKEVCAYMVENT